MYVLEKLILKKLTVLVCFIFDEGQSEVLKSYQLQWAQKNIKDFWLFSSTTYFILYCLLELLV